MCGRYAQNTELKVLADRFKLAKGPRVYTPQPEIAPTQLAPVIVEDDGRALRLMRWGLVPHWAKELSIGSKMFNARAETLEEKPSFKGPLEKTRCLVPADCFYEWKDKKKLRIAPTRGVFAMAGLWETWRDPSGKLVRSFTIITTQAGPALAGVHERMPVILSPENEAAWLNPKTHVSELRALLVAGTEALDVAPAA